MDLGSLSVTDLSWEPLRLLRCVLWQGSSSGGTVRSPFVVSSKQTVKGINSPFHLPQFSPGRARALAHGVDWDNECVIALFRIRRDPVLVGTCQCWLVQAMPQALSLRSLVGCLLVWVCWLFFFGLCVLKLIKCFS